ncbi:MAG: DUF1028 domain-containing protein [Caldilineaceae bacterium]
MMNTSQPIATFSIVAYDPARVEWGVAVQSKFLAVGAVVPWARAGAGVVATQSYANLAYGPDGLDLMAQGMSAEETLATLTDADPGRAQRQAGLVDRAGRWHLYRRRVPLWAVAPRGRRVCVPGQYSRAGHGGGHGRCVGGRAARAGRTGRLAGRRPWPRVSCGGDSQTPGRGRDGGAAAATAAIMTVTWDLRGRRSHADCAPATVGRDASPLLRRGGLGQRGAALAAIAAELQAMLRATGDYTGPQHGDLDAATHGLARSSAAKSGRTLGRDGRRNRWTGAGLPAPPVRIGEHHGKRFTAGGRAERAPVTGALGCIGVGHAHAGVDGAGGRL